MPLIQSACYPPLGLLRPSPLWRQSTSRLAALASDMEVSLSIAGHRHFRDLQGRAGNPASEDEIIADNLDVAEHLFQIPRDGNLLDRIRQLTVFDPKSARPTGVVSGHHIDPKADQFRDVQPVLDTADNVLRRAGSRSEIEICRADRRTLSHAP